jgi:hypothetical protein
MSIGKYLVVAAAAIFGAAGLCWGPDASHARGGGAFSVSVAPRIVVAPRVVVTPRGTAVRIAVPKVGAARTAARPSTTTRHRLNSAAAIRAGGPRYITVTRTATGDRCAHLLSRAGPPTMHSHYIWMSRYNQCKGQ